MTQVYHGKKDLPDGTTRVAIVNGFEGLMTKSGKPRIWNGKFTLHYWISKYIGKKFSMPIQGKVRGIQNQDEAEKLAYEWVHNGTIPTIHNLLVH